MPSKVSDALASVASDTPAQPAGSLEAANRLVARMRDLEQEIASLDERRDELAAHLFTIRTKTLVDLMSSVGLKKIAIEASGNAPAYEATLRPYYKASIPADWPEEKQAAAFDWLDKNGDGDLVKHTFTIALDREDFEDAEAVRTAMNVLEIPFEERRAVHHATLTAWLKEQIGEKKRTGIPLDVLGASVGQLVDVKALKTK